MNHKTFEELYQYFLQSDRISIDSRTNCENTFFVAIKGEAFNGNLYAEQARKKGAKYAVVDQKDCEDRENHIFYVENTIVFLQQLAKHHREQFDIPIIGITGTNGKTTTKELSEAVLSKKYCVLATKGNLNNHIGVPLTLLQLNKEYEIAVIEMGASRPGEIKELCDIAQPNYGLITNIGAAHLEGFQTIDAIIQTKRALYDAVAKKNGTVFVDEGNPILNTILPYRIKKIKYIARKRIEFISKVASDRFVEKIPDDQISYTKDYTWGEVASWDDIKRRELFICNEVLIDMHESGIHVNGIMHEMNPYLNFFFTCEPIMMSEDGELSDRGNILATPTKLFGEYNIQNCLAAITIGHFFGVSTEDISEAIIHYQPSNMRSQVVQTKTNTLLVDCYNANPSSMVTALASFYANFTQNKELYGERYVILGDMLELGDQRLKEHHHVLQRLKKYDLKGITVGETFASLNSPNIEHQFKTTEELIDFLKENPIQNKWILLKGSRGIQLEKLIDYL